MEAGRGLVYPTVALLDDVSIDNATFTVVKVDMVHDNAKDLKLEVPPDDTTLTLRDAVTRRVQWRRTLIDVDPAAASALSTPSQPPLPLSSTDNVTRPAPTIPEPRSQSLPISDQPLLSPPRSHSSTPTAPDPTQPSTAPKKSKKKLSKEQKAKEQKGKEKAVQTAWTSVNPYYEAGKPMLTSSELRAAGQYCVDLHNYYINNNKTLDGILVEYKERHFLQTDGIFLVTFGDLYDLFKLNALDISLLHCFAL